MTELVFNSGLLVAMAIVTFLMFKKPSARRAARPAALLTALTLLEIVALTNDAAAMSDPVIRYTISWPQKLVMIWFVFEVVRARKLAMHDN